MCPRGVDFPLGFRLRTALPFLSPFQPSEQSWGSRKRNCNGSFLHTPSRRYALRTTLTPKSIVPIPCALGMLAASHRQSCRCIRKEEDVRGWSDLACRIHSRLRVCQRSVDLFSLKTERKLPFSDQPSRHRRHHADCPPCAPRNRRSCDRPRGGATFPIQRTREKLSC